MCVWLRVYCTPWRQARDSACWRWWQDGRSKRSFFLTHYFIVNIARGGRRWKVETKADIWVLKRQEGRMKRENAALHQTVMMKLLRIESWALLENDTQTAPLIRFQLAGQTQQQLCGKDSNLNTHHRKRHLNPVHVCTYSHCTGSLKRSNWARLLSACHACLDLQCGSRTETPLAPPQVALLLLKTLA